MGFRLLLLMFAGVTLGGLGTAYGALVGSLVVGVVVQMSTLVIPGDIKYVGVAALHRHPPFRPQGILGSRVTGRIGMSELLDAFTGGLQAASATRRSSSSCSPSASTPLRLHRPAELRPGRVRAARRLRAGGHGRALGLPIWVGILVGIAASVVLALLLGIPTLRLRADYLAIVTIAAAEILRLVFRSVWATPSPAAPAVCRGFNAGFYALAPSRRTRYGILGMRLERRQLWVTLVGWILVALSGLLVCSLIHSPWGRVVGHPRGRGRRPQPRARTSTGTRCRPHPRRRHRRPRRHRLASASAR